MKYCGEVAKEVMDEGYSVAKLKPGVLGVKVRIMKPDAHLPDEITIRDPEPTKAEEKKEVKEEQPAEKVEKPAVKPEKETQTSIGEITKIEGIGPSVVKKLEKAGVKSLEELYEMEVEDIIAIEGIGQKTAENMLKKLQKLLQEVA